MGNKPEQAPHQRYTNVNYTEKMCWLSFVIIKLQIKTTGYYYKLLEWLK